MIHKASRYVSIVIVFGLHDFVLHRVESASKTEVRFLVVLPDLAALQSRPRLVPRGLSLSLI
jgi:hypothetical protein